MTPQSDGLWLIDASTITAGLARALSQPLGYPIYPVTSSNVPSASCACALVEILLPGTCGLTLAAHLQSTNSTIVAVWSSRPIPLYSWVAWRVGLHGCLDKDAPWDETLEWLKELVRGASIWPPRIWKQTQTFEAQMGWRLRHLDESDWARWLDLLRPYSFKQLGSLWNLTPRGAAKATTRLCEKLGVVDRVEAMVLAQSWGLVKMEREIRWSEAVLVYYTHRTTIQLDNVSVPGRSL